MGTALDTHELAWAAGLFDAEGSAGAYRTRNHYSPRLSLSQAGEVRPEVLERFHSAVGGKGCFIGPVRGYLYYWYTHRFETIQAASAMLWPWLSRPKRVQVRRTLLLARGLDPGDVMPSAPMPRDPPHELAWAAGFFGGEGSISARASIDRSRRRYIKMSIVQAAAAGTDLPELLIRFRAAVGNLGRFRGPREPTNPWSRRSQYEWFASSHADVSSVVEALRPWLDIRKLKQANRALDRYRSTPSLRELRQQTSRAHPVAAESRRARAPRLSS